MLSQNFLPADQLGLTEKQRDAMIMFLGMCERGEIRTCGWGDWRDGTLKGASALHMAMWWSERGPECGTVGCIGGWVEHLSNSNIDCSLDALDNLFHPPRWADDDFTLDQIAAATRNYLTTGQAKWEDILS